MKKMFLQILTAAKLLPQKLGAGLKKAFDTWPKAFVGTIVLIAFLYYPVGGLMSEKIDRTADYDFSALPAEQSQGVEMAAYLINREVNEHIWAPNLPFFFPASSLDNMPNFQTGIMRGLADVVRAMARQVQCADNEKAGLYMKDAAKLLAYPGNVWLFAPDNRLKTAPSSSSQYRKARKKLKDVNKALQEERCFWVRDEAGLAAINRAVVRGLAKTAVQIENEIREGSSRWTDSRADDVFYYSQGRIYAYMTVLKKLGRDYKQVLMSANLYPEWTVMLRALQTGAEIDPGVVVNGGLNGEMKANHLIGLGYYIVKAENILMKINAILNGEKENAH